MKFRDRLIAALERLRALGYLAEGNFECCSSCAGSVLTDRASAMIAAGAPIESIRGAVYWHGETNDSIDGEDVRPGDGSVYLNFGQMESRVFGTIGIPAVEAGLEVVAALEAEGVVASWDGDPDHRVLASEVQHDAD